MLPYTKEPFTGGGECGFLLNQGADRPCAQDTHQGWCPLQALRIVPAISSSPGGGVFRPHHRGRIEGGQTTHPVTLVSMNFIFLLRVICTYFVY